MITRRTLVTATLAAAAVAPTLAEAASTHPIDRLIALSRDKDGEAHVHAVAFVGLDGNVAPCDHLAALAITAEEARALADAFRDRDHARFHLRGPTVAGRRYVFVAEDEDGRRIRARRAGHTLIVQATDRGIVVAQAIPGMQLNLANLAVWRFTQPA